MAFELTIAEGTDRGRRFRFEAAEVTIGRGLASDLLLLDPKIVFMVSAPVLMTGLSWWR